jgi:exonuclease SbcC
LDILEVSHTELNKRTLELQKLKEKLLDSIARHNKQFIWNKYLTFDELNSAFDDMELIQKRIKFFETELINKVEDLKSHEDKLERARVKLEDIKNMLTINRTHLLTLHQQLQTINPKDYLECNDQTIIEKRNILLDEYSQIEKDYTLNVNLLKKMSRQRDILKGRHDTNISELEKEISFIMKLENDIDKELAESDFTSIDEVQNILSDTIDIKVDKLRIEEFKNSLLKIRSTFEQYQNEVGESEYDSEVHTQLINEIETINTQLGIMNKDHGRINELHKSLLKNIEIQLSLRNELKALETRSDNIKTMKSLFKASGFVNYISSVYLQNLCNTANSRFFQLTRQKLSLEISEDNNFKVRDFMNGGKERSVKTLSGGQTFQASLSLALALADNIQKITESDQNFFFLDEGFGSLDKESLNIVFDTLKSLRKENRIVGVISHVEEMQQEIEAHLHIVNHEEMGSIIHPGWSNNY